jgi:hypothetical protein
MRSKPLLRRKGCKDADSMMMGRTEYCANRSDVVFEVPPVAV